MGAELDVKANIGNAQVELDLVAGAVKKGMADAMQSWRKAGAPLVKRVDFSGTVTAAQAGLTTATAFVTFSPDSPQVGRLWSVRKLVIQAGTATAFNSSALSNVTAVVFVTGQAGGIAALSQNPPLQDADVTSLPVPTTQYFSANQLWVRGQDSLVIGIQGTGVVAGLQIFGHARVMEIDDDPGFLLDL
jgi:hypothetical protein